MTKQSILKITGILIIAIIFSSCNSNNNTGTSSKATAENLFEPKIDSILELMTLDEKIGQLNLPTSGDITTGTAKGTDVGERIKEGKLVGYSILKQQKKFMKFKKLL